MKTKFTRQELLNKYNKLSGKRQALILWEALDYMNQYNGRTRADCVVLAMGDALGLVHTDGNIQEFSRDKTLTKRF